MTQQGTLKGVCFGHIYQMIHTLHVRCFVTYVRICTYGDHVMS
jgi:hypothetical protein